MANQFVGILILSLFVTAVVDCIKPLWSRNGAKVEVAEIVSMAVGVVIAVSCRINLLSYVTGEFLEIHGPVWVEYIFFAMTGLAMGRGASFVKDLWVRIQKIAQPEVTGVLELVAEDKPEEAEDAQERTLDH